MRTFTGSIGLKNCKIIFRIYYYVEEKKASFKYRALYRYYLLQGEEAYISYVLFCRFEWQSSHMNTVNTGITAPRVIIASVIIALHVHTAAHPHIAAARSVIVSTSPWAAIKV